MHLNAPEYLPFLSGVILVLLLYIFLRRRTIIQVGYFSIWKEVLEENKTQSKLKFRRILSIILAVTIYLLIFLGLTQAEFDLSHNFENNYKNRKPKKILIVDTYFETFPNQQAEKLANNILYKLSQDTKGFVVYEDSAGVKFRKFTDAYKNKWFENVIYHPIDLSAIIAELSKHTEIYESIEILTFNREIIDKLISDLTTKLANNSESKAPKQLQLIEKLKIFRLPFTYLQTSEKSNISNKKETLENKTKFVDLSIEEITPFPAYPAQVEYFEIKLKNYSAFQVKCELATRINDDFSTNLVFKPGEEIIKRVNVSNIKQSASRFLLNLDTFPRISIKEIEKYSNLTPKKFENLFLSIQLKILDENFVDVRPDNNYYNASLQNSKIPKAALIGDEANTDYNRLIFETLQDLKIIQLVKLKSNPEIVFQVGETELEIPKPAHIIIFKQKFPSLQTPSIYFWKNNDFVNKNLLQAEKFSIKQTGVLTMLEGEVLIDSSVGALAKIFKNPENTIIEFAFSINSENSDFCLRPKLAPIVFNSLISGLMKDKFFMNFPSSIQSNQKTSIFFQNNLAKTIELSAIINGSAVSLKPSSNGINYIPVIDQANLYVLKTNDMNYYFPVNSPRTPINIDKVVTTTILQYVWKKNTTPINFNKSSKNDALFFLLIKIALGLILIETILYRFKISE